MKKLIEGKQENLIECDNDFCGYAIVNPTQSIFENISGFVNKPCPVCGDNLLTEEDFLMHKKLIAGIKLINKWFGWVSYLIPSKYETKAIVKVHKGIDIKEK